MNLQDPNTRLVLRSVWDWREQFNDQDILLFHNPLFNPPVPSSPSCPKGIKTAFLKPLYRIPCLEIWSQCYFRWIPHLVINNGGRNQIEMYARLLQNDVAQLQMDISGGGGTSSSPVDKISTYLLQMNINSFYPFSNKKSGNTVSTPIINSSFIMSESMIDAESLLTAPD
jgi:myotubularin-related protein 10/11/12